MPFAEFDNTQVAPGRAAFARASTDSDDSPRLIEYADSIATLVAVIPSVPHRSAPKAIPTIPSTDGIPIASSTVEVPRSLHDDR